MSGPVGAVSSIVNSRTSSTWLANVTMVTCSWARNRANLPVRVGSVPVKAFIAAFS